MNDVLFSGHRIQNAIGSFEDVQLLDLRVLTLPEETTTTRYRPSAQLLHGFRWQILRVFFAPLRFVPPRPIRHDLLQISPRAACEYYVEAVFGHRCSTFFRNSSAAKVRPA